MLAKEDYQRYSRQLLVEPFDETAQQNLLQASVLIVGMGGLGCAAAQYLVGSGIGHVLLMDPDTVEVSNLHRQPLYTEDDVGHYKAEAAARRLLKMNRSVRVSALTYRATDAELKAFIPLVDGVLDCTDNLATRFSINEMAYQFNTPLFIGAATGNSGQFIALNPQQHHGCYACLYSPEQDTGNNCIAQGILGPVVALAGNYQALATMHYLSQMNQPDWGHLHVFDGINMQWRKFSIPRRPDCPVCGRK